MRHLALGHRLFLLAMAGILPLAIMSGIGVVGLVQQQRAQAERATLEITRALATAVEAELQRTGSVLEAFASSATLDTSNAAEFYQSAQRMAKAQPNWLTVILIDPDGTVLFNANQSDPSKVQKVAERDSFQKTIRTRLPVVGYLARGASGSYGIPLRVPVVRQGQLHYVLTAVIKPQAILDIIKRQRVPDDWIVSVFDGKGARVARSISHDKFIGGRAAPSLSRLMASGAPEGFGETEVLEGSKVYTAFSRTAISDWSVAIGVPTATIDSAGYRSLSAYGSGILISLVLGVIGALVVARSIKHPIESLRRAALALGRGESFTVPPITIPEAREVGNALQTAMHQHAQSEAERQTLLADAQEARNQAERANRVKDQFMAMLGHELRNPLAPIISALDIMEARHSGVDVRERHIIERQVAHLSRLVDDLLDVARISGGKLELRRSRIELGAVANRALELMQPVFDKRPSPLEVRLPTAPVYVYGDAVRLVQVMTNLLANAAKFTRSDDKIALHIDVVDNSALIEVIDAGCGISPVLLPHIFDLFAQGEQSIDRRNGGLGLGLAIVKNLVLLHEGTISADSGGPGCGSTFTVRLPLSTAPPALPAAMLTDAPAKAGPGRQVLIVDDNADAAEMLACLLGEAAGFTVRTAADGASALELVEEFTPDIAVLDIGLPGMDGYELAQRLRRDPRFAGIKMVALTGYGTEQDRKRALESGFDAHCIKPVALENLLAVIDG
jgi:signal transduction histidine kinase